MPARRRHGKRGAGDDEDAPAQWSHALRILLPLVVLASGMALVWALVVTAPEPERAPVAADGALVSVVRAREADEPPVIEALGTVTPALEVDIVPQVSGLVVWASPVLAPGSRLEPGDVIVRLDRAEYELAIAEQRARIADAELALIRERAEQAVEARTRALFPEDPVQPTREGRELAQRRPQLEAAQRQLDAARSLLGRAELELERTTITSPCACTVASENVDVGQRVSPQASIATLVGTDAYHVEVSVPVHTLGALRVSVADQPGQAREGSPARVIMALRGADRVWQARLVRLVPSVTEQGRMAQLIVAVPNPVDQDVPLLLGSLVRVEIEAEPIEGAVRVPRAALREGERVFVVSDGSLAIRDVDVAWQTEHSLLVTSGVRPGERVIIDRIAAPVEGMRVRVASEDEALLARRDEAG